MAAILTPTRLENLAAAGYETLRFTDRQITRRPATVVAAIRAAATGRPGGAP